MGGSMILHRARHLILPNDSLYDRVKFWVLIAVIAACVLAAVSNVIRVRRGKHRADPVLKAAVDRLVEVEKLATGGGPLTERVRADEARLERLENQVREALELIVQAYDEAGQPVPEEFEQARRRPAWLRGVINGGAA